MFYKLNFLIYSGGGCGYVDAVDVLFVVCRRSTFVGKRFSGLIPILFQLDHLCTKGFYFLILDLLIKF